MFRFSILRPKKMTILKALQTDITTLTIDVIINAANTRLRGGGGVDGAIHRKAGPGLLKELTKLYPNGCNTADAKISNSHNMRNIKKIIHTVGPVVHREDFDENGLVKNDTKDILAKCYTNCLDLCVNEGLKSVAFPCISTGVYGYPQDQACDLVVETVRNWVGNVENEGKIDEIIFCCFLDDDMELYSRKL